MGGSATTPRSSERRAVCHTKSMRSRSQPLVPGPQSEPRVESRRCQEVHIDQAQTLAEQVVSFDEMTDFVRRGNGRSRERIEVTKQFTPTPERSERQLPDDHRMHHHLGRLEVGHQFGIGSSEVIDPHRRVDEDHELTDVLRRGGALACLSEPPNAMSRREVSIWTNASSPLRTRTELSSLPVNARARSSSSSSIVTVVRTLSSLQRVSASSTASDDTSFDAASLRALRARSATGRAHGHVLAEAHPSREPTGRADPT